MKKCIQASRIPHTALTVYLTLNQNERDQLTKYRMNQSFYFYDFKFYLHKTGTLFEAAGLLLQIVFQSGITTLFGVEKDKPFCGELANSTMADLKNYTIAGDFTTIAGDFTTTATNVDLRPQVDSAIPANVVILI